MTYLEDLRQLATLHHSVVSVYLSMRTEVGDQGAEVPLRWRRLREQLSDAGAPHRELDVAERVILSRPAGFPHGHAIVVADGELRLDAELPGWTQPDAARHGVVVHAVPFLRWLQERVPLVLVVTDRTGADIAAYDGDGRLVSTLDVTGPDDEIERNAPGGTAQLRYQHRAEDSWAHNAAVVAGGVTRVAQRTGAEAIVAAGDVRAVQLLRDHLPPRLREDLHVTHADQPNAGRNIVSPARLHAVVAEAASERRAERLRELNEAVPSKRAVTGMSDTFEALRGANVRRLYLTDLPTDDRRAWIGAEPTQITLRHPPRAVAEPTCQVALVDALVHAAWGTDAEVVVLDPVEASLTDGVAALLRH